MNHGAVEVEAKDEAVLLGGHGSDRSDAAGLVEIALMP
jgi:hypothetical protein